MKTILITGASDGIGRAAARQLSARGHRVIAVGRDPEKTRAVGEELRAPHHVCDFADLKDVRRLAADVLEQHAAIDVLCNNAGGMMGSRQVTTDGHEATWQVNHLAPFLLTNLLLPRLIESRATVIATSSVVARMAKPDLDDLNSESSYSAAKAYYVAKLADIWFTKELVRRFHDRGISAVSFEPGAVATSFGKQTFMTRMLYQSPLRRLMRTPDQGAELMVRLADTTPGLDWEQGGHYGKGMKLAKTHPLADDPTVAAQVWKLSDEMVGGIGAF